MTRDTLTYYIIEHPTKGVLMSMEETDGGKVGRFSWSKPRDKALRWSDANACANARRKVTATEPDDCIIMKYDGADYSRVLLGPVEEPRPGTKTGRFAAS